MKTFLNSFWNSVSYLKFHLQQFSPQWKFQKFPFPPLFLPLLILKNFSSPWILLSSKIQLPLLHKEGEATMKSRLDVIIYGLIKLTCTVVLKKRFTKKKQNLTNVTIKSLYFCYVFFMQFEIAFIASVKWIHDWIFYLRMFQA